MLALPGRGRIGRTGGVLEAHGGALGMLLRRGLPGARGIEALALGHVLLARDAAALERWRAHERVHVRQCECWGPLFLPAYACASAWALLRGGHPYRDNAFEREARAAESAGG